MRKLAVPVSVLLVVAFSGCPTIRTEHKIEAHIVIDVRYVKEQAADIVGFVTSESGGSGQPTGSSGVRSALSRVLASLSFSGCAYAAELPKTVTTPIMRAAAEAMKARNPQLKEYKDKGCVGETNAGYVAYRRTDECEQDASLKAKVLALIEAENKDRSALYTEVAKQGADVTLEDIEAIYAMEWAKKAKTGDWVQAPQVGRYFEQFKASPLGQKLKDVKPGAWYQVP